MHISSSVFSLLLRKIGYKPGSAPTLDLIMAVIMTVAHGTQYFEYHSCTFYSLVQILRFLDVL